MPQATESLYHYCVTEWSEQEVVDNYLKPTGFDYLSNTFMEQHVTGAVLLALSVSIGII